MKTTLFTCALGLAALLAGTAVAGDQPRGPTRRATSCVPTRTAMVASRAPKRRPPAHERSGEWFDKLDPNKDGYVTQDEIEAGARDAPPDAR